MKLNNEWKKMKLNYKCKKKKKLDSELRIH